MLIGNPRYHAIGDTLNGSRDETTYVVLLDTCLTVSWKCCCRILSAFVLCCTHRVFVVVDVFP